MPTQPILRWSVTSLIVAVFTSLTGLSQTNSFGPVSVPATSTIFDPDNILSNAELVALGPQPKEPNPASPAVLAISFKARPGQTLTLSASGMVGNHLALTVGPSGYQGVPMNITSLGSISGFDAPNAFPLVGVFTDGSPTTTVAPPDYDYSDGLDQASFRPPELNQVFYIGTGNDSSGVAQVFSVPPTATELWLGFVDGGNFVGPPGVYGDNVGALTVSGELSSSKCTPPPSAEVPLTLFSPQPQQEGNWCWAAVTRMLAINAEREPAVSQPTQCTIVNDVLAKGDDPASPTTPYCCSHPDACNSGASVPTGLLALGYEASLRGTPVLGIGGLSPEDIKKQIACKARIVGFQIHTISYHWYQHAMVIYGYKVVSGQLILSIYDPIGKVPTSVSYDNLINGVLSGYDFSQFYYDVRRLR